MDISSYGTINILNVITNSISSGNLGTGASRELLLSAHDSTGGSTVTATLQYNTPTSNLTFSTPTYIKNVASPSDDADVATKLFVTTHSTNTSNPHNVTKTQIGLSEVQNIKQNFTATTSPTTANDAAAGYSVGSQWINTTTDISYICVDASNGVAVWNTTGAGSPIISFFNKSTTSMHTNATIYIQSGVTETPAAGTYNVSATVTCMCSTNYGTIAIALAIDGVAIADSQVIIRQSQSTSIYTQYTITVNGAQTISLMYKKYSGTGYVQLSYKSLIGIKI